MTPGSPCAAPRRCFICVCLSAFWLFVETYGCKVSPIFIPLALYVISNLWNPISWWFLFLLLFFLPFFIDHIHPPLRSLTFCVGQTSQFSFDTLCCGHSLPCMWTKSGEQWIKLSNGLCEYVCQWRMGHHKENITLHTLDRANNWGRAGCTHTRKHTCTYIHTKHFTLSLFIFRRPITFYLLFHWANKTETSSVVCSMIIKAPCQMTVSCDNIWSIYTVKSYSNQRHCWCFLRILLPAEL